MLAHEWGHAVGYRDPVGYLVNPETGERDTHHSPVRGSVMFPVWTRTVDVCRGERPAQFAPGAVIRL